MNMVLFPFVYFRKVEYAEDRHSLTKPNESVQEEEMFDREHCPCIGMLKSHSLLIKYMIFSDSAYSTLLIKCIIGHLAYSTLLIKCIIGHSAYSTLLIKCLIWQVGIQYFVDLKYHFASQHTVLC